MTPGPSTEPVTDAEILTTVSKLIEEVVGAEYSLGLEIDMDTSFQGDLELESLEFVELAEKLIETYGEHVDFAGWLATMDVDEIIAMTVGELVAYIHTSLDDAGAA